MNDGLSLEDLIAAKKILEENDHIKPRTPYRCDVCGVGGEIAMFKGNFYCFKHFVEVV